LPIETFKNLTGTNVRAYFVEAVLERKKVFSRLTPARPPNLKDDIISFYAHFCKILAILDP
jgi:hypothetical protein